MTDVAEQLGSFVFHFLLPSNNGSFSNFSKQWSISVTSGPGFVPGR